MKRKERIGSIGNASDGMVDLEGAGGGKVLVRVRVSRYQRDPTPGQAQPSAEACALLNGTLDLASLHVLSGKALRELCDGPGKKGADHFIAWARQIHDSKAYPAPPCPEDRG